MSCADVQTIQAGNGAKTQFSFDFPYIFKSEIKVSFWNATTKEWDDKAQNDATYPWQVTDANPTIVEFTGTAPPAPAVPVDPGESAVDNVRIRRVTNIDDIRALFNPGSAIRSDDLNRNFEQLRYAIQESNCQGITEDVYQYLLDNYWDRFDNTVYSTDTWVSDDTKIATTQSIDQRIDNKIDDALTIDIDGSDGITITDDTPSGGQIVVGIGAGSVDLDRIKDEDILTYTEQEAGAPSWDSDGRIPTTYAAARRFDTLVQPSTPVGSNWSVGKTWLQNTADLTLSVWNGSAWLGVASGGTFTNQPKVVYVDASSGDDANDGHRISRPKLTIKAAIEQINADATYGDGSVVIVAAGVYQEAAPIQIQKKNVSIIGQALRSCIVHPTVATETNTLFEVNSGSYVANLTLTGMKAGTGTGNTLDPALPTTQGWNFAFYSGATITKSPYIQNCTNFSDSEIDNSNLNANNPAGGAAGDTDSAPTGGGLLVNGATVDSASPLRSMVCDSYTHVGLNGPGILVTNNGYAQCTSSYAFFNKYHIKCLNGGQANLAASTTDFGDQALVADGRSTTAIFTAALSTAASDQDITFTIDAPTADASWHGSATRPATNMLVELNSVIYPILSATANGSGWDVTISRPNPNNRSENLGLNGAVSTPATASFFLRSMIASSGHTMEYVGSGTDYRALPENGGVPDETKQITESNNGKVWTAITDHNGKFKIGGNQTTDPIFEVDQQLGFVTIPEGSIAFNLLSDQTPQLGGNLDANGNDIILDTGAAATPSLTFDGDTNTGIYSPGADQVAVVTNASERIRIGANGELGLSGANYGTSGQVLTSAGSGAAPTWGTAASVTTSDTAPVSPSDGDLWYDSVGGRTYVYYDDGDTSQWVDTSPQGSGVSDAISEGDTSAEVIDTGSDGRFVVTTEGSERLRITSAGLVGIGTSSPSEKLHVSAASGDVAALVECPGHPILRLKTTGTTDNTSVDFADSGSDTQCRLIYTHNTNLFSIQHSGNNALSIDSSGRVGIGTTSPSGLLSVHEATASTSNFINVTNAATGASSWLNGLLFGVNSSGAGLCWQSENLDFLFGTNNTERVRINSSGNVGIGTSSPGQLLHLNKSGSSCEMRITSSFADFLIQTGNAGDDGLHFYDMTNSAYRMMISNAGNVGIGTTTPGSYNADGNQLVVGSGSGNQGLTINAGASSLASIFFAKGTGGSDPVKTFIKADGATESLAFGTANTERMRINSAGDFICPNIYNGAVANAANVYVGANGQLYRSTSSIKYKTDVETLQDSYADAILGCRPVWYRSTSSDDNPNHGFWGFIAEEVAAIDPRLVQWKTAQISYDEKGSAVETQLDTPEPDGVQYDRFVPHLLNLIKRQQQAIETLEAANTDLAARLTALEGGTN
jgi:hypothetical protein